jgi:signal transduction histidine kinase
MGPQDENRPFHHAPRLQALIGMYVTSSRDLGPGVALELAAHRAEAERLSLYEDRDRIARDLHDLVIQRLYATVCR